MSQFTSTTMTKSRVVLHRPRVVMWKTIESQGRALMMRVLDWSEGCHRRDLCVSRRTLGQVEWLERGSAHCTNEKVLAWMDLVLRRTVEDPILVQRKRLGI